MTDLHRLKERIEQAEGPNFALDWEIHCMNGLEGVGMYGRHPAYTASLDAALALVERMLPGWIWAVGFTSGDHKRRFAKLSCPTEDAEKDVLCFGPIPALAILSALLTALSKGKSHDASNRSFAHDK